MLIKRLKMHQVVEATELPRSEIYHRTKHDDFPPPIPIGFGCVGWSKEEICLWIESRIEKKLVSSERRS
jgi:predicted DNA-binding transcriptional regulator AlpA